MIKLSEQLAQKIVDRMTKVIPYNVIITDEQGIIIGSGDLKRINKFHSVAKKVLEIKEMIEIPSNDPSVGVNSGVNVPIFFEGKLVGVIGIAGDPKVVKPFSELVSITAELLINQEYVLNEVKAKEHEKEKFLYELAYTKDEYSQSFIERGISLGIDITINHTAVVINCDEKTLTKIKNYLNSSLEKKEYYLILNPNNIAVFMYSDKQLIQRLERILDNMACENISLGVGLAETNIATSINQALRAIELGKKLEHKKNIYLYKDMYFISMLANFAGHYKLENAAEKLKLEGKQAELLETLAAYVYNNGEANKTAEALHIHRNTLNYRLEKIQEISGKNPRNLIELFELFTAYVVSML
jgi:carbohydrate diacid regulator